jgi:hypothetical protein
MKKAILFLFLFIPIILSAASYYVAPTGNDSNPGTISQPFFTLNKAWTVISAGDIVYLRGGTYFFPTSQELTGKNGASGNLIKIWAYPGESPVITKASGWTYKNGDGIHFEGNYFHWKGIEIKGFVQLNTYIFNGLQAIYSSHNIFELLNIHHNGKGFELSHGCNDNLVLIVTFIIIMTPLHQMTLMETLMEHLQTRMPEVLIHSKDAVFGQIQMMVLICLHQRD